MDQGVLTRIIQRYRWFLERVTGELDREKITNLLVEEHQKARAARSGGPT